MVGMIVRNSGYSLRLQDGPVTVFLNKKNSLIQKIVFNLRECDDNQQTPACKDKISVNGKVKSATS